MLLRKIAANRAKSQLRPHPVLSRYEHRYDRQQYRAIEALERMQERRIARAKQSHGALENNEPAQ